MLGGRVVEQNAHYLAYWKNFNLISYDPLRFDLECDPCELRSLAGTPEAATIQQELHGELLHLIPNPDEITERAFAAQAALLDKMLRTNTGEGFYEELRSRLGAGQARILASQFYRGGTAATGRR